MKNTRCRIYALLGLSVILGALFWFRTPDARPVVRASSFSSFPVPEHLHATAFAERLASIGFVAATDATFRSLLPSTHHVAHSAPGHPAPDFTSMPAYRHTANSQSHTRILGYDLHNRMIHYYHAQVLDRQSTGTASTKDEPDSIEEELRK